MVRSSAILARCTPIPLPPPLQKGFQGFLFRFTLISRMVLGVGKKSEIRPKSENFDPCKKSHNFGIWLPATKVRQILTPVAKNHNSTYHFVNPESQWHGLCYSTSWSWRSLCHYHILVFI